jgi:hypothetical protein
MLKSYEAIFENGQMTWTLDQPVIESARVIVTIVEDLSPRLPKRRTASPLIAGLGKTIGDVVSPIVDEQDWECLT